MSFLGHVVVLLLIVAAVVLIGAVTAFFMVRRLARRRWREIRSHVVTRSVLTGLWAVTAWGGRRQVRVRTDGLKHATAARARRQMWIAIEDAEVAVDHTDAHDAPVAELPAVCRSLRRVGGELDRLLCLERKLTVGEGGPGAVRNQVSEVILAARDVQSAALRACSDATAPQIQALVRAAREEIEIVGTALSRMRSVAPH